MERGRDTLNYEQKTIYWEWTLSTTLIVQATELEQHGEFFSFHNKKGGNTGVYIKDFSQSLNSERTEV